jgi:hypothetical protein
MEEKSNNVENTLSWIEKLSNLIRKAGLQNIVLTIMVLFIVIAVGQFVFNPEGIIERYEEINEKRHTESVIKRLENEPEIRRNLIELKNELNADRVYVLETHNGGSNLAGLPFLYVDLTYAEPKSSLTWLESEYKNVRLSRYPWATELYQNSFYSEPVEYLKELDPELYLRLKAEDVSYMAAIMMYGSSNPSGVIGVVYTTHDSMPSKEDIQKGLIKYASKLSPLFNNE